jgi:hypothetical protein
MRSNRYYNHEWRNLRRESIAGREPELVALASCHPSGHVREAALRAMSVSPDNLPFAILRLGDWVDAVRSVALDLFRAQADSLAAETLVAHFPLLVRVRLGEEYSRWLDAALRRPSAADALRAGARSGIPAVRLRCCRLLAGDEGVMLGLDDGDAVVRRWAFGAAAGRLSHEELMRRAEGDADVRIRRLAFGGALTKKQLRTFLFDRARSIRGEAQTRFGPAAAEEYRGTLRSEGVSVAAVVGIGETGDRPDRELIVPLLGHASARIRRAAVRTAAGFGCEGLEAILLRIVERDRPAVSGLAASALLRERVAGAEVVWRAAVVNPQAGAARRVLSRMKVAGKWERLAVYLDAANSGQFDAAVGLIRSWTAHYNRSAIRPTALEIAVVRERFAVAKGRLPRHVADEIAFTIRDL